MSKISKNIRDIRIAHGETQKELAIAINVSESAIANYETEQREPDMQILKSIAERYGFPVDRLMNEDFSQMDFKLSTMTWQKTMEILAVQFPIICTDRAMQDKSFAEGYRRTQEIWNKVKEGQTYIMDSFIESAFQEYENAYINNNDIVEAIANILWLTFLVYALLPDEHFVKMGEAIMFGKSLNRNFVKNYVLKDSNPISKENFENKRAYIEKSQDAMLELIRILKESEKYSDLADYYMALRYVIGMVANDYSDDLNKTIGMEMLTSFAQLGNKYVIKYFKAVKNL